MQLSKVLLALSLVGGTTGCGDVSSKKQAANERADANGQNTGCFFAAQNLTEGTRPSFCAQTKGGYLIKPEWCKKEGGRLQAACPGDDVVMRCETPDQESKMEVVLYKGWSPEITCAALMAAQAG